MSHVRLSGWGRYPRAECELVAAWTADDVVREIAGRSRLIARGAGRAYGDAALNPDATLDMGRLNRLLSFDGETGLLACQAGERLGDILGVFGPRGWFPPVTPGTRHVTVGGMIAADVHGKNHHGEGSFGAHLEWIDLAGADGGIVRCSPAERTDLFEATIGGMGLTGVILAAAFRLKPIETGLIRQKLARADNLDHALHVFESEARWTYSVAWIDCMAKGARLGRSLVYLGEHASRAEAPGGGRPYRARSPRLAAPFDLPGFTLNGLSIRAFNALYAALPRPAEGFVEADPYFYPLDAVADWNRIYGGRGFVQHQCVLPLHVGRDGLVEILGRVSAHGSGAFLAVLKRFGPAGRGLMSFPMEGYTLAMDFPADADHFRLLDALDAAVVAHGGRLYLAKDARQSAATLAAGYPRLTEFAAARERSGANGRFDSLLSRRLGL